MYEFKITNIKLSVKTTFVRLDTVKTHLQNKKNSVKSYPNFLVIKNKFTYVYFKSKDQKINHLNITNVDSFKNIDSSINHILKKLPKKSKVKEIYRSIDNITASLNLNRKVCLQEALKHFINVCEISYNSEKFPGAFLKFEKGTIILFHTGKCIFIGCKRLESLKYLEKQIKTCLSIV